MTTHHAGAAPAAPWHAGAAYLYTLDLDGPALAWEYLRRNPAYRVQWHAARRARCAFDALHWGLRCRRRSGARCPPGATAVAAAERCTAACARGQRSRSGSA
ncbi:transcriptional regulator domain-containing protein [Variovorax sp.]|uniref:transcriptional regulator domain-containing protein n=1 Tax=Variovorax sp. TaxID=1871043 RepID=UPI0037D9CBC6